MKEFLIDLYPRGGGSLSKIRVFAPNQAAAMRTAKQQNPKFKIGGIKEI